MLKPCFCRNVNYTLFCRLSSSSKPAPLHWSRRKLFCAHLVTAVHAGHALREADHALQLPHRYPPGRSGHASRAVTLSQALVLLDDELLGFAGDLQTRHEQPLKYKPQAQNWSERTINATQTLGLNWRAKSRYLRISSRVYSLSTDSSMRECRSTMRLAIA